jgi:hypothetical protein
VVCGPQFEKRWIKGYEKEGFAAFIINLVEVEKDICKRYSAMQGSSVCKKIAILHCLR